MVSWIIEGELAVSARPGYTPGEERAAPWRRWRRGSRRRGRRGVRSVICLLAEDQLPLYRGALPEGLLARYRAAGFEVAHHGVPDGLTEPFTAAQLNEAWASFRRLPKPVLVHCSAGHDRTGRVVRHILRRLEAEGRGRGEGAQAPRARRTASVNSSTVAMSGSSVRASSTQRRASLRE